MSQFMKVLCSLYTDVLRLRSLIEIPCHTATLLRPNHELKYFEKSCFKYVFNNAAWYRQ